MSEGFPLVVPHWCLLVGIPSNRYRLLLECAVDYRVRPSEESRMYVTPPSEDINV